MTPGYLLQLERIFMIATGAIDLMAMSNELPEAEFRQYTAASQAARARRRAA